MSSKIKVSVIVTDQNDNILLLKEKVEKNDQPLWNIIKGSYGDNKKETIFEAAKRECREETSIDVELIATTGCYLTEKQKGGYQLQFNFIGKIISGTPTIANLNEQQSHNECFTEVKWFDKKEVKNMPQKEFISKKIYIIVQDWLRGDNYPLSSFKQLKIKD